MKPGKRERKKRNPKTLEKEVKSYKGRSKSEQELSIGVFFVRGEKKRKEETRRENNKGNKEWNKKTAITAGVPTGKTKIGNLN